MRGKQVPLGKALTRDGADRFNRSMVLGRAMLLYSVRDFEKRSELPLKDTGFPTKALGNDEKAVSRDIFLQIHE